MSGGLDAQGKILEDPGGAAVEFSQEESGASAVQGQGYAQGGGEVPKEVRDTPETAEAPRE